MEKDRRATKLDVTGGGADGKKINLMEKELMYILLELNILAIGKMECITVRELMSFQTVVFMLVDVCAGWS